MDGQTDALTVGYLLGTYSARKSSQESISTQQIPDKFYGINLIVDEIVDQTGNGRIQKKFSERVQLFFPNTTKMGASLARQPNAI